MNANVFSHSSYNSLSSDTTYACGKDLLKNIISEDQVKVSEFKICISHQKL